MKKRPIYYFIQLKTNQIVDSSSVTNRIDIKLKFEINENPY